MQTMETWNITDTAGKVMKQEPTEKAGLLLEVPARRDCVLTSTHQLEIREPEEITISLSLEKLFASRTEINTYSGVPFSYQSKKRVCLTGSCV